MPRLPPYFRRATSVMIGFGITLPGLPFYVERLAQGEGATRRAIVMHAALLTAAYPLGQLVFAPVWGRWSDRTGRRPLLLIGIAGDVIAQILFGALSERATRPVESRPAAAPAGSATVRSCKSATGGPKGRRRATRCRRG